MGLVPDRVIKIGEPQLEQKAHIPITIATDLIPVSAQPKKVQL